MKIQKIFEHYLLYLIMLLLYPFSHYYSFMFLETLMIVIFICDTLNKIIWNSFFAIIIFHVTKVLRILKTVNFYIFSLAFMIKNKNIFKVMPF